MTQNLYHPFKFSDKVTIPGNLFLAPMAGYTDAAWRGFAALWGSDMGYTEMVSCEALSRDSARTMGMMRKADEEKFYAIQIFVSNPETAVKALPQVLEQDPSVIDINCGCPVPKVLKSGCGAALGRDPEKLHSIVKALTERTDVPVTVKIRSGWDKNSLNFLEAADAAQQAGAAAVTLHPRTRSQDYAGNADWTLIKKLKEHVHIPVIASGDMFSPEAVKEVLETTGCDGVMIARGAVGYPEIFRYSRELLTTGEYTKILQKQKLENAMEHFRRSVKYIGAEMACKEMKKHLCCYTKGLPGSAEIRNRIVFCTKAEEYLGILRDFMSQC
ncbi:MAG: tRNA dihydrouridine synthase DusB [Spirochaetia bacterium]|nr:tRNA dihydrouridine synthase DusB [Spirochaetia bacterium]